MPRSAVSMPLLKALAATALCLLVVRVEAAGRFETDVAAGIDRGIEWLAQRGAFANPSAAVDGAGLPMLALLNKPVGANALFFPQGYRDADAIDQARLRAVAAYLLDRVNETGFFSFRDGNYMLALSMYALTGGPDKGEAPEIPDTADYLTLRQAMDTLVDRAIANQRKAPQFAEPARQGYWCYSNNFCEDTPNTQFVAAGLSAARDFYFNGPVADPARIAAIDAALALARAAFELNAVQGSTSANCKVLSPTEGGHGYQSFSSSSDRPTLQQTSAGLYVQLLGGSNLDSPNVQAYLEWQRNRYRWQDLADAGGAYSSLSYWYYVWVSSKVFYWLASSGVRPDAGNLGPKDLGTLPANDAPACAARQVHKDPLAYPRVPSFGAGGVGYYSDAPKSLYFDYAHQLLTHQCFQVNSGYFGCNGAPGGWNHFSTQSYALLTLTSALPEVEPDADGDGVLDFIDNCVLTPNPGQEDRDGDGVGDACDNCPDTPNPEQADTDRNGIGDACEDTRCDLDDDGDIDKTDIEVIVSLRGRSAPPAPAAADADGNGIVNINDARACVLKCTRAKCATR